MESPAADNDNDFDSVIDNLSIAYSRAASPDPSLQRSSSVFFEDSIASTESDTHGPQKILKLNKNGVPLSQIYSARREDTWDELGRLDRERAAFAEEEKRIKRLHASERLAHQQLEQIQQKSSRKEEAKAVDAYYSMLAESARREALDQEKQSHLEKKKRQVEFFGKVRTDLISKERRAYEIRSTEAAVDKKMILRNIITKGACGGIARREKLLSYRNGLKRDAEAQRSLSPSTSLFIMDPGCRDSDPNSDEGVRIPLLSLEGTPIVNATDPRSVLTQSRGRNRDKLQYIFQDNPNFITQLGRHCYNYCIYTDFLIKRNRSLGRVEDYETVKAQRARELTKDWESQKLVHVTEKEELVRREAASFQQYVASLRNRDEEACHEQQRSKAARKKYQEELETQIKQSRNVLLRQLTETMSSVERSYNANQLKKLKD
jgi:hypothetical protein